VISSAQGCHIDDCEDGIFALLTRALQLVIFTGHFLFNQLINKAKTAIWLTVKAKITDIVPETFKTVAEGFKESMRIIFDDFLGKLNDKTIPLQS